MKHSSSPLRLLLYAGYVLLFVVYPLFPADRSSTEVFLWWSTVHSVLGLGLALTEKEDWKISRVWLLFLLPRLMVFPMQPWLSDDVFRYLWDGTLTTHGLNCYAHLPNAPELTFLHGDLYHQMDYKNISTLYPALSQILFALSVWIGNLFTTSWMGPYIAWKIILLSCEAAGLFFLIKTVRLLHLPLHRMGLYLFLTLPVIELAGQAHMDGLLILPMGMLVWLCTKAFAGEKGMQSVMNSSFSWQVGVLAGILFLIKLMPVVLVLPLLRLRINFIYFLTAATLTIFLLSLPFFLHPLALPSFLAVIQFYSNVAQFNGVPLYLLNALFQYLPIRNWWLITPSVLSAVRLGGTLYAGLRSRAKDISHLYQLMFSTLLIVVLLSAKVHIWYFAPLLFLNVLTGWSSWMLFAQAGILTYAIYAGAQVQEAYTLEYILWAMGFLLGGAEFIQRRNTERSL